MKNAVADSTLLWPDAAVIYRLDKRIGADMTESASQKLKMFIFKTKKYLNHLQGVRIPNSAQS